MIRSADKLDRGQRVLDLMRDAARDIAPGGHALAPTQVRSRRQRPPHSLLDRRLRCAVLTCGPAGFPACPCGSGESLLAPPCRCLSCKRSKQVRQIPARLDQAACDRHVPSADQAVRFAARLTNSIRPSASRPITPAVTFDSTESNRRRRSSVRSWLSISASTLTFQLPGHLVEKPAQHGNFVVAFFFDHLHVQIARADALGRPGKATNRAAKTFGKPQATARPRPQSGSPQSPR